MPHYIYKEIGETPLDLIKKLKTDSNRKYSFAGRLDPMARGQMIILEGEVSVNNEIESRIRRKLRAGDIVELGDQKVEVTE